MTASTPKNATLMFKGRPLLIVDEIELHQGTWMANYSMSAFLKEQKDTRVGEYFRFYMSWSEAVSNGEDRDAAEFNQFSDVMDMWTVEFEDGTSALIEHAPTFTEYEVSFRTKGAS